MRAVSLVNVLLGVLSIHNRTDHPSDQAAVVEIANSYSERTVHIVPVVPSPLLSDTLIRFLKKPVIINALSKSQQWQTDIYVVVSQDVSTLIDFVQNAPRSAFRKDTQWILKFTREVKIEELGNVFQKFFNRGFLNVVSVHLKGSDSFVYTYKPFRKEGCYNYHPVVVDVWSAHRLLHRAEMFPKNKVDNLCKCSINTSITTMPPYIDYSEGSRYPLRGRGTFLFKALQTTMNFRPVFSLVKNSSLALEDLRSSPTVFSFGLVPAPGFDFGYTLGSRCVSWCLPTSVEHIRGAKALTNTFSLNLWLACAGSVFFAVVIMIHIARSSGYNSQTRMLPSWFVVWQIIVEAPALGKAKDTKLRVFLICFIIAFLVLGALFKARLHVLMCGVPTVSRIPTNSQVYDSQLDLIVPTALIWMLQTIHNETFYKERARFYDMHHKNTMTYLINMFEGGKGAVLMSSEYCKAIANTMGKTNEGYYKTYSLPECIRTSPSLGFLFSQESPFGERIRRITRALWEGGISNKYLLTTAPPENLSSENVVISFQDIGVVVWILLGGLALSAVVFVIEILSPNNGRNERKNKCFP